MSKAKRPVFIPLPDQFPYIKEILVEFEWFPGFALSQAQKSIDSLHRNAGKAGIRPVLEISSKSLQMLGVSLSAFNLKFEPPGQKRISVECAFQGSKIFQKGGPFTELYFRTSKEAKMDPRLRNSGDLTGFSYFGKSFPTNPLTAFYDWLYITALSQNLELAQQLLQYQGFTDIAFNPAKSFSCQARSAALYMSLHASGLIEQAVNDQEFYIGLISNRREPKDPPRPQQLNLF